MIISRSNGILLILEEDLEENNVSKVSLFIYTVKTCHYLKVMSFSKNICIAIEIYCCFFIRFSRTLQYMNSRCIKVFYSVFLENRFKIEAIICKPNKEPNKTFNVKKRPR